MADRRYSLQSCLPAWQDLTKTEIACVAMVKNGPAIFTCFSPKIAVHVPSGLWERSMTALPNRERVTLWHQWLYDLQGWVKKDTVSSSASLGYLFLEPNWVVRESKSVKWERPLGDSHDSTERNQNIWPGLPVPPSTSQDFPSNSRTSQESPSWVTQIRKDESVKLLVLIKSMQFWIGCGVRHNWNREVATH